jgi:DNA polymerase
MSANERRVSSRRQQYLARIGISVFELRRGPVDLEPCAGPALPAAQESVDRPDVDRPDVDRPDNAARPAPSASTTDPWVDLSARVAACTRCALHRGRTQTVFGVGRRDAELMVIGEAPGAEEDRQGEPFVGRAGQLLNAMLRAIRLPREQVYIANILKCRPPHNRDPSPEETGLCTEYLSEQIELVAPLALLGVGRIAAQWLLQTDLPIGRLRGRTHRFGARGIPLIVTYHPAYLLRTPSAKANAWQDLCMVRRLIAAGGAEAGAAFEKTAR